jgi:Tfp pilus assembly protein PilO
MKRTIALVVAPAVAVVGGWYGLVYRSAADDAAAARSDTAKARQELATINARLAATANEPNDPAALLAQLTTAKAALPAGSDLSGYLTATDEASKAAGVSIVATDPKPPSPGKTSGLSSIDVNQTVTGERARLLDFLDRLQNLPRLVRVNGVNLTAESSGLTTMVLRTTIYFRTH